MKHFEVQCLMQLNSFQSELEVYLRVEKLITQVH